MEAGKGCWGKDCCTRDSWEAVGDPYWNVRLAKGVCTGGLQMDVVNEQGDMMAPTGCCKGVGGFGEEVLKLP